MNKIQTQQQNNQLITLITSDQMKNQMLKALPKHLNPERMIRVVLTALRNNPKLSQCNRESFLGALMQSAQLGLEPNTPLGQSYLIPYGEECNFQVGYKGIIDLAHRTGRYEFIYAQEVYPNDRIEVSLGLEPNLIHIPADEPEGEANRYYAVYKLTNGGKAFRVWSRQKILNHAKQYSKGFHKTNSPWKTAFDAMAKKTVLLDLLKTAPLSPEMSDALSYDEKNIIASQDSSNNIILDAINDQIEDKRTGPNDDDLQKILDDRKKKSNTVKKESTKIISHEAENDNEVPLIEIEGEEKIDQAKYKENNEIYGTIKAFKEHENIVNNQDLVSKLTILESKVLTKNDSSILVSSIRKANTGDYSGIDELIANRVSF